MDRGWFSPVVPVMLRTGTTHQVNNVLQAADILLHRWPIHDSPVQVAARRACLNFIEGRGTADEVREAFERAAEEAEILMR